jgi:hypothetical protein
MATYNFDFFQIQPHKLEDGWVAGDAQSIRAFDARISNFNAMWRGARMSTDRTRTTLDFAKQQNPKEMVGVGYGTDWAEYNYNPYVAGSTVKRILDDQAHKMMMDHDRGAAHSIFHIDVSDMDEVTAAGIAAGATFLNYPTEGWNSFGKKYDDHAVYQG